MAKGTGSYIRKKDLEDVKLIDHCQYCGSKNDLCVDHIIPPKRGGNSRRNNLIRACVSCNASKSDFLPSEWLVRLHIEYMKIKDKHDRLNRIINFIIDNNLTNGTQG